MLNNYMRRNFSLTLKTIYRFEAQNKNWRWRDLDFHSEAFANGLRDNGINKQVLFWMHSNHYSEYLCALIGCLKANVDHKALSQVEKDETKVTQSLKDLLIKENPQMLLLSPNQKVQNSKRLDVLYKQIPEVKKHLRSQYMNLNDIKNLKLIVQSGLYNKDGVVKYRDFLVYKEKKQNFDKLKKLAEDKIKDSKNIDKYSQKDQIYYIGDIEDNHQEVIDLTLGSLIKDYFVCFISKEQYNQLENNFFDDLPEKDSVVLLENGKKQELGKRQIRDM